MLVLTVGLSDQQSGTASSVLLISYRVFKYSTISKLIIDWWNLSHKRMNSNFFP